MRTNSPVGGSAGSSHACLEHICDV